MSCQMRTRFEHPLQEPEKYAAQPPRRFPTIPERACATFAHRGLRRAQKTSSLLASGSREPIETSKKLSFESLLYAQVCMALNKSFYSESLEPGDDGQAIFWAIAAAQHRASSPSTCMKYGTFAEIEQAEPAVILM